jgi:importin subunit beta-1
LIADGYLLGGYATQLTVLGMKHTEEAVALQAIEFWSTVCDEEIDIHVEEAEAQEFDETPERESQHFAKIALPDILPVLLDLLTKQEEEAEEDEWNVSMAAGTCITLLAQCVEDAIVTPVIPFVENNIKLPDWHRREAAVMAFGSILDGPSQKLLSPLVTQALSLLVEMLRDPDVHVKDTTSWTIGRITDMVVTTIQAEIHLAPLVTALVASLEDPAARVVCNCCWSLMNLGEQLGSRDAETTELSPFYEIIVDALLRLGER